MRLITANKQQRMGSLFSSIETEKVRLFTENNIMNKSCRNCWACYLCGGMCYGDSFAVTGDIRKPVSGFCQITRYKIEVAAYILKKLKEKGKIKEPKKKSLLRKLLQRLGSSQQSYDEREA